MAGSSLSSMEGMLYKLGGIMKNWKHRYAVIRNDKILYYETKRKHDSGGSSSGSISLCGCSLFIINSEVSDRAESSVTLFYKSPDEREDREDREERDDREGEDDQKESMEALFKVKKKHCTDEHRHNVFAIKPRDTSRMYVLRAETLNLRNSWLQAIKNVAKNSTLPRLSPANDSSSSSSSSCPGCRKTFSMLRGKHACQRCGLFHCSSCLKKMKNKGVPQEELKQFVHPVSSSLSLCPPCLSICQVSSSSSSSGSGHQRAHTLEESTLQNWLDDDDDDDDDDNSEPELEHEHHVDAHALTQADLVQPEYFKGLNNNNNNNNRSSSINPVHSSVNVSVSASSRAPSSRAVVVSGHAGDLDYDDDDSERRRLPAPDFTKPNSNKSSTAASSTTRSASNSILGLSAPVVHSEPKIQLAYHRNTDDSLALPSSLRKVTSSSSDRDDSDSDSANAYRTLRGDDDEQEEEGTHDYNGDNKCKCKCLIS